MVQQVGAVEVEVSANLDPYQKGLQDAQRQAVAFNAEAVKAMQGLTKAVNELKESMAGVGQATEGASKSVGLFEGLARRALGVFAGLQLDKFIGNIPAAIQSAVGAFDEWSAEQDRFAGRMEATRGVIGLTQEDIQSLARTVSEGAELFNVSAQQARNAIFQMGQAGQIAGETLREATEFLPELTRRVGDFGQASRLLAQSLADPRQAFILLRQAGIEFDEEQQEVLRGTETLEDRFRNAALVIRALRDELGGEGGRRDTGLINQLSRLGEELKKLFGGFLSGAAEGSGLNRLFAAIADELRRVNEQFFPENQQQRLDAATRGVEQLRRELQLLQEEAARVTLPGTTGRPAQQRQIAQTQAMLDQAEMTRTIEAHRLAEERSATIMNQMNQQLEDRRSAVNNVTDAYERQAALLRRAGTRAEAEAIRQLFAQGVDMRTEEGQEQLRRLAAAIKAVTDERRRLAQAERPTVFALENERLERQIELFQFGNEEMRIRNQLNQIALRAERARQPLTRQQLEDLDENIRALRELQRLTGVVEAAFTSLFSSMGNAIAEFAATGKFDFKQFADSVIRDLVRIGMQAFVVKPLMELVTGFTNPAIAGALGIKFPPTGGGVSIPGAQHGGSFMVPGSGSGDRPMLLGLSPGERVDVTPANQARKGGGGVTVINNVNSSREFQVQKTEREGPDGTRIIEQTFTEVMRRVARGDGDATFGARFGMRARTAQR